MYLEVGEVLKVVLPGSGNDLPGASVCLRGTGGRGKLWINC